MRITDDTRFVDLPSFRTDGWNAEKFRKLVFMIYSKGTLISKVTGGSFGADKDWCEAHKKDDSLDSEKLTEVVNNGQISGLAFKDGYVIFSGLSECYPEMSDDEKFACLALFQKIVSYVDDDKHQRVQIKEDESENEKYAFRCWITRLGWTEQYKSDKDARAFLYSKLSGHVAFKTKEDEGRWKETQARRKAERQTA